MSRKLLLILGLLASVLVPTAALAGPNLAREYAVGRQLAAVRQATARYHAVQAALDDGFVQVSPCVPEMGFHYARADRMTEDALDPLEPEILIYAPGGDGELKLVAVEYWMAITSEGQAAPELFGRPFDGPHPPVGPGFPPNFDLHAWIWQANPDGVFTPSNPTISC